MNEYVFETGMSEKELDDAFSDFDFFDRMIESLNEVRDFQLGNSVLVEHVVSA